MRILGVVVIFGYFTYMGPRVNYGPIRLKFDTKINATKILVSAEFKKIIDIFKCFMTYRVLFREDICMGAMGNYVPIPTKINRLLLWPKKMTCAEFHPITSKNATCSVRTRTYGQPTSRRTDGRTDGHG